MSAMPRNGMNGIGRSAVAHNGIASLSHQIIIHDIKAMTCHALVLRPAGVGRMRMVAAINGPSHSATVRIDKFKHKTISSFQPEDHQSDGGGDDATVDYSTDGTSANYLVSPYSRAPPSSGDTLTLNYMFSGNRSNEGLGPVFKLLNEAIGDLDRTIGTHGFDLVAIFDKNVVALTGHGQLARLGHGFVLPVLVDANVD